MSRLGERTVPLGDFLRESSVNLRHGPELLQVEPCLVVKQLLTINVHADRVHSATSARPGVISKATNDSRPRKCGLQWMSPVEWRRGGVSQFVSRNTPAA